MTNKVGIYYAYWTKDWNVDFLPYVDKVASIGFDVLEINSDSFIQMPVQTRNHLAEAAKEKGLDLTFCVGLANEYDLAAESGPIRKRGIQYLRGTIEKISAVGFNKLSGIIYSSWNPVRFPDNELEKRAAVQRSLDSMKEIAAIAEDYGVYCNLEVVNRFEQFIINTCAEAVEYVRLINSPNVRILLDSYHMNIEEDSFREAILLAGEMLGHVHIGENNRKPPGQGGHLDWQEFFTALNEIEYSGYIVMEPFVRQGGLVGKDIKVWRNLEDEVDMDNQAKQALEFVKGNLKNASPKL